MVQFAEKVIEMPLPDEDRNYVLTLGTAVGEIKVSLISEYYESPADESKLFESYTFWVDEKDYSLRVISEYRPDNVRYARQPFTANRGVAAYPGEHYIQLDPELIRPAALEALAWYLPGDSSNKWVDSVFRQGFTDPIHLRVTGFYHGGCVRRPVPQELKDLKREERRKTRACRMR